MVPRITVFVKHSADCKIDLKADLGGAVGAVNTSAGFTTASQHRQAVKTRSWDAAEERAVVFLARPN
jgi:hypothetical protein